MPEPTRLNEKQIAGMLAEIFKVSYGNKTAEEVLEAADALDSHRAPFPLEEVRVIRERTDLRKEILHPGSNKLLLPRMLRETPDTVCVASDQKLMGKDALYFCIACEHADISEPRAWLEASLPPALLVGTAGEYVYAASPVLSFR